MPVSRLTGAVPFLCRSPLFALFLMILLFPLLLGVALGEAMTVFAGELATALPAGQD
jgi:hypothetical protein